MIWVTTDFSKMFTYGNTKFYSWMILFFNIWTRLKHYNTGFPRKIKTCNDLLQLNFATCITGQKQLNLGVHQLVLVSACICKCLLFCLQAFGVQFLVHMDIHRWHYFLDATNFFLFIPFKKQYEPKFYTSISRNHDSKSMIQQPQKHRYFCIIV